MNRPGFGIYLHVPYCRVVCPYCNFVKRSSRGEDFQRFVAALTLEIERFEGPDEASTIFFGGGTPSLLEPALLECVLEALHKRFQIHESETTLEANPEDIDAGRLKAWHALGINRVSIGVQSLDDDVLRYLGRGHDASTARKACAAAAEAGGDWSVDLMFGAHPADAWENTLQACAAYRPPHVSAYGLTYEPKTPFAKRAHEAVSDTRYLAQYWSVEAAMPWLERYEVSNLAAPGHESRHNLVYWHNGPYAGFGPGAVGYVNSVRCRNVPRLSDYLRNPGQKIERLALSPQEEKVETLMQAMRLRSGLEYARYSARFGTALADDFPDEILQMREQGLAEPTPEALVPTRKGFELNDEIGLILVGALAAA